MKLPDFTYHRPPDLATAVELLGQLGDDAKVIAGGQSLLPMLALRLAQPAHLVDIAAVEGLGRIESTDRGVTIGATVTQRTVERDATMATDHPLLVEAVGHVGHPQTRARGTICGSMAHADPSAELPAVALALDATFTVAGRDGRRDVDAADFFQGFMTTDLADDEILTAVTFPHVVGRRGAALVEVSRRSGDFALMGAVCSLELDRDDRIADARVVLFGIADTPIRVGVAESSLRGAPADAPAFDLGDLRAQSDPHASASYRRHIAHHVVAEAVGDAIERARRTVL